MAASAARRDQPGHLAHALYAMLALLALLALALCGGAAAAERLRERADVEMYKAKAAGRNRWSIAENE